MMTAVTLLSFMLELGASQCFFRDHTTITHLLAPVPVALGDPTSRPAVARSSTSSRSQLDHSPVPGCPFWTVICTDASTGELLRYVAESGQVTASPQEAESGQAIASLPAAVSSQIVASGQVAASCSCQSLAHPTVLWHHRLGHPSIPRLRSMASHRLVSGLPRVFASLHPSPALPCTPCGPEREHYFLVVVDDYSRYTTVFPLAKMSEMTSTLIRWLLAIEGTRGSVSPVFTPTQNGVAERHIGLAMDIARTSMIHAHAPHFLWPYVVRYAAHQLILQSRVSWPEASPTSLWTRSLGVGSAFRVLDCLALVCDTSADKLSARAIPCVFLGFPMDSPDYGFYHPPLHQFLDSSDVQFDDSMSYYARYPCQGLPVPPPPLYLAPSPSPAPVPPVPPPPPGPAPSSVSHATPLPSVARQGVGSGGAAIEGTRFGGALLRSARAGGHGTGGASSGGAGAGGASAGGASFGGARAGGASAGGAGDGGAGAGGSSSGGAGAGDAGAGGVSFGGAGVGGTGTGGASSEETGAGGTTPAPPHRHDTRLADTLRELLHVAAQRDYELHSLDFSTAFLQASLHEEIWLCRPPGFTGTFSHGTQWSLGRPVYGLCQAPCKWHDMLCTTLAALKFPDRAALAEVKSKLQKRHTCTDLGELRRYLGLQITRERAARTITLSQSHMVQQVLQQFGLQHSTTQPTALSVDHRLTGPFPDEPFESSGPYAELVGCLMYLMACTRPDLAFPLCVLSCFVATGRLL
ncbi:unnamed protein product [Closterium sp. NIES-53]